MIMISWPVRCARVFAEVVGWVALAVMVGNASGALDVRLYVDPVQPVVHEEVTT